MTQHADIAIEVDIEYATTNSHCPPPALIKQWVSAALIQQATTGALSLKIIDEPEMTLLNHTYRNKNKVTNVLSFPCQFPFLQENLLGDIALCAAVIEQEALLQKKDLTAHWAHLVIHGVLHLLGYNHEQENEATVMEGLEITILSSLGFPNPYQTQAEIHDE